MPSRRNMLRSAAGGAGLVAASLVGLNWRRLTGSAAADSAPTRRVPAENQLAGTTAWMITDGLHAADDFAMQIKGFASTTSATIGEKIDFHVTMAHAGTYVVDVYRLGYYAGTRARLVQTSPKLTGVRQPAPDHDPTSGLISCRWPASWSTTVTVDWTPGYYLAAFTTASGFRSYAPFVVRDQHRSGGLCVVLPFTTYQAYNQWPFDGVTGKNLYYGFGADGKATWLTRAKEVSFDRPYWKDGLPKLFADDHTFVTWAEQSNYDVNYASSVDVDNGRLDPSAYAGMVFAGHDEYWSETMRSWVSAAIAGGTSIAFLGANNIYWPIKFHPAADGRSHRRMFCEKAGPGTGLGGYRRWRDPAPAPAAPEQRLLGVQFNGVVKGQAPLIVKNADHWLWRGCDVVDGDQISRMVGVEADGVDATAALPTGVTQTLLSSSPYFDTWGAPQTQATSVYETRSGAIMFVAGTLTWTRGLGADGYADSRIIQATKNVLDRMHLPRRA